MAVDFNSQFGRVERNIIYVHNAAGEDLPPGTPVYITPYDSDRGIAHVGKADSADPSKMPAIGVTSRTLKSNRDGEIIIGGYAQISIEGIAGVTVGASLYVAAGGGLSITPGSDPQVISSVLDIKEGVVKSFLVAFGGASAGGGITSLPLQEVLDEGNIAEGANAFVDLYTDASRTYRGALSPANLTLTAPGANFILTTSGISHSLASGLTAQTLSVSTLQQFVYTWINSTTAVQFRAEDTGFKYSLSSTAGAATLEFDNIDGLQINNPAITGYKFPLTDGTADQYLQTDGNGTLSFATISATLEGLTDTPSGYGTAGQVLITNGVDGFTFGSGSPWVSDTNGITYTAGNVGIGAASSSSFDLNVGSGIILGSGQMLFNSISDGIRLQSVFNTTAGVGIGYQAIASGGPGSVAIGNQVRSPNSGTVVIGYATQAMSYSASDPRAVHIGHNAANTVTSASDTIAIGNSPLSSLTTGSGNLAIGRTAGSAITTQTYNTFVGYEAGRTSTGEGNTFIGKEAGELATTGIFNTAVGLKAGQNNTTGSENVFIGYLAGGNYIGSGSVIIGRAATATSGLTNARVVAVGYGASVSGARGIAIGASTAAESGVAIGTAQALANEVSIGTSAGDGRSSSEYGHSVFIGYSAGLNSSGSAVIIGGVNAGTNASLGDSIGIGSNVLSSANVSDSVAIGRQSGASASGTRNIYIGEYAGSTTTGDDNVILGWHNTNTARSITGSVFIGRSAGDFETNSNKLYIANSDTTTPLIYGDFNNNQLRVNGGLTLTDPANTGITPVPAAAGEISMQNASSGIIIQSTSSSGSGSNFPFSIALGSALTLSSTGNTNIILGRQITSSGAVTQSVVMGYNKTAKNNSVTIGGGGTGVVEIKGTSASNGVAIHGTTTGGYSVAVGFSAIATANSVAMGHSAKAGDNGASVGIRAGQDSTGTYNTNIGSYTGYSSGVKTYDYATLVGASAGRNITTGDYNTSIGYESGYTVGAGERNVFLGYRAGYSETGSNKLYISNSGTTTPLIYGEFDNKLCRVNGNFQRVVFGSTETTTSGTIHIRDNTDWSTQADATDNTASTGLLGIALGATADVGLVLFGDVDYTITGNVGTPVYLDTTAGGFTTTAPTGSGNIVRVMGHIIGSNKIFFNPSNDWLEIV